MSALLGASSSSSSYLPSRPDSLLASHHAPRSFVNMGSIDLRNQLPASNPNVSLDPIPGSTFAETLKTWNDQHVTRWLADMKCGVHAPTFRANDIRGDLLLELDQPTLKEMSITNIGDRIRILNGVKLLRQRAADKTPSPIRSTRPTDTHTRSNSETLRSEQGNGLTRSHPRKESRPPPLILPLNPSKGENLPVLVGDSGPDSARTIPVQQPVRPLPVPTRSTPNATQLSTPHRTHLPPAPPPPSSQIPPPPLGASRTPAFTPTLPSQVIQTNGANWDPSRSKTPNRSTSPLQVGRVRGPVPKVTSPNSGRNGRIVNHPYSGIQSTLHPPANTQGHNLSPIEETFGNSTNSSTSTLATQSQYGSSRPSYHSASSSYNNSTPPSLDDIRKKIVKFVIPDEGTSYKIDVTDCSSGHEVIEKVLKKFGKGSLRNLENDNHGERSEDGYLSVDGWAVYTDYSDDPASEPLSSAQLLSICNAPDHPARERGLTVRRLRRFEDRSASPHSRNLNSQGQTPKSTKRASSISILSSLGVRNPEVALSDPPSPTAEAAPSSSTSPPAWLGTGKRPSKLRNFFGQRPPSELITSHLGEFFPSAEPNVLRTARHSMALARQSTVYSKRRQSTASNVGGGLASRFSISTQGSGTRSISPPPPPLPNKPSDGEPIPRMSLSTEDGRSVDLHSEDEDGSPGAPKPQLPPIPLGDSSFSESMEEITHSRPVSRAQSTRRLSFMSELRSQRDVSDTASLMTVDEVTAEIENRRASKMRDPDLEGWTKVDTEPAVPADEVDDEGTLATEDDELEDDLDDDDDLSTDDEFDLAIPSRTTNKWVKGRLIGAGSFGQVYLGMDATSGLLMAVKQVELPKGNGPNHDRKKSMLSALEREIELLKVLEHENIVQYLYSSLDDEFLNIFLEYVPGGSVATLLQNYGAFEETLVRNFVRQILRGLNYLHERDIIHRDIKGANILVDNKGGVKISDFGISKKADGNIMPGGNRMNRPSLQGSVFWMAPEVVKQTGHTKKADIWSVGCLVVEMLTGEHPWAQLTQMQAIFKIGSSAKPTIPTDISPEAQEFLQKTFEINHELRPPAADLLQHPWLSRRAKKAQNAANAAAAAAAASEAAS